MVIHGGSTAFQVKRREIQQVTEPLTKPRTQIKLENVCFEKKSVSSQRFHLQHSLTLNVGYQILKSNSPILETM